MVDYSSVTYQEDMESVFPYLKKLLEHKEENRILITGATGLVGSFLTDAIRAYERENSIEKIKLFLLSRDKKKVHQRFLGVEQENITILEYDIRHEFPDEIEFDYIIHLASNANPRAYAEYPVETIETNVQGAMRLTDYLKKHLNTKAVYASSMEVYGEIEKEPIKEGDSGVLDFNKLRAGYSESKRVAELLLRSAEEEYGIHCMIARLGYLYGPTMLDEDNKIVSELIRKAHQKEPVTLRTSGIQKRTYCYVGDAVTALLTLLQHGENSEPINVANRDSEITIRELAELVCRMYGLELTVQDEVIPRTSTNIVLDTNKLEGLGWRAMTSLQEGLKKSVAIWSS